MDETFRRYREALQTRAAADESMRMALDFVTRAGRGGPSRGRLLLEDARERLAAATREVREAERALREAFSRRQRAR